jgi:hypothetical protein
MFTGDGYMEPDKSAFHQTLFSISDLANGLHTVKLANNPNGDKVFVDLDWATIMTGDGDATNPNYDVWVDNTHGNWTYERGWIAGNGDLNAQYINETF